MPPKEDYMTEDSCNTQHGWLKKLFCGLGALVIAVGGLLFTMSTSNSSAMSTMDVRVKNHTEQIKEIKGNIKEIKTTQQNIRIDTTKILYELRNRRNITKGE